MGYRFTAHLDLESSSSFYYSWQRPTVLNPSPSYFVYILGSDRDAAAFCRDHNGNYLGASSVVFYGINDPATLEVLACREALALVEDLALNKLLIAKQRCPTFRKEQWEVMG
jgi:hypothetical protein